MNRHLFAALAAASIFVSVPTTRAEQAPKKPVAKQVAPKPANQAIQLENLLRSRLARVSNTEVIVSRVILAPNTAMPRHTHPGEEFAYVIAGSVTLFVDGQEPVTSKAGDVGHVPLDKSHSAKSGDQGVTLLVFRVHEAGKPERVLVK